MNSIYKMTIEELTEEMARSLLEKMVEASKNQKLSEVEVEKIAKGFVTGYPYSSREDLLEAVFEAIKDYSFLLNVYAKYKGEFEENKTSQKLESVRQEIQIMKGVKYGN